MSNKKEYQLTEMFQYLIHADENLLTAYELAFIADMYYNGNVVTADLDKAILYGRKAAERGDAITQRNLGYWLLEQSEANKPEALRWMKEAADNGEPIAQYDIAISYDKGDFGEPDHAKCVEYMREAALRGHGEACSWYACEQLALKGVGSNTIRAFEAKGNALSKYWAVRGYFFGGTDLRDRMLSEDDYIDGEIQTGIIINDAADMGETQAMADLVATMAQGEYELDESEQSRIKAAITDITSFIFTPLLEEGVAKGNLDCIYFAGNQALQKGDYKKAFKLLGEAAERNEEHAQYLLADMYRQGNGTEKNLEKALYCCEKSIGLGNKDANALRMDMCQYDGVDDHLPQEMKEIRLRLLSSQVK